MTTDEQILLWIFEGYCLAGSLWCASLILAIPLRAIKKAVGLSENERLM